MNQEINKEIFKAFPILESERLIFRAIELEDTATILSIRSNKKVMEYMDSKPLNEESALSFIQENINDYKGGKGIFWAIVNKSSQEMIGDFAYWKLIDQHCRGEIGYTLHPNAWGKGFMRETMKTLLPFGFDNMNLHSIEANINPMNERSRNALIKLGFEKEAYFKENYQHGGVFYDSEIYSLLKRNMKL